MNEQRRDQQSGIPETAVEQRAEDQTRRLTREITERRRIERELRNSEALYSSLVESVPLFIIRKDLQGRFTFANRAFCELLGRPAEEIIGRTDFDFSPSDLAEKYRRDDRHVVETGELIREIEENREGAQPRHFEVLKAPVRDAAGEIVGIQAVFWDVTERVEAEHALQESAARRRAVFQAAMDCIILVARDGRILEFNRAAEETFGYEAAEVLGSDVNELLFPQDVHGGVAAQLAEDLQDPGDSSLLGASLELVARRKTGETFLAELNMQSVPLEGERVFAVFLRDVTEQQRARRELDRFFNLSWDMLCIADLEGRFRRVNPAFERTLGWSGEELLSRPFIEFVHPDDRAATLAEMEKLSGGEPTIYFENRYQCRDDGYKWLSWTAQPVVEEGVVYAIARDTTERKEYEAALDRERYLLHTLLDNLPHSIYFKDRQSHFLRVSRALAERFGLDDPEEAVGRTDFDFFTDEHARQAREDEKRLMQTGRPIVDKEEKETWPDGRETWAATSKLPLRDREGNIIGTFGVSRDITEQVQARQALQESERRTRQIVETALDAFVSMDESGRIVNWNSQAEQTFGWKREEAIGRSVAETIIPPRYRQAHSQGLKKFLETGDGPVLNQRIEIAALHRDGREFPVEIAISPVPTNDGYLFHAFVHDISRRKEQEQALHDAKEAAEKASRAKSEFLANMSHEIRTPMNAVIGMTELVLDTELTRTQREYLTTVLESGESLLYIINDILDFSKIEAGKLELEQRRFNVRECLGDTMKSLAVRAHHKGLELACRIAPDVPHWLVGDAGRLRQIVVNLVGNAIKFTERGEVVLEVQPDGRAMPNRASRSRQAAGDPQPGGVPDTATLHFSVRDTGIGIAEDKLQAIFEAFEQADTSMTRRFSGTGLGLAISSKLVELMNGSIRVESRLGEGSTFHFTATLPTADGPETPVEREPAQLHGTPVLIVDDNATNREILEEMLKSWEMEPMAVASAAEALSALRSDFHAGRPIPLVVCDVHMPGVDGFTLAEKIRSDGELGSTLIMMLTSGDRPSDTARCEELGTAAYLLKPVKQSELFDAIVLALGIEQAEEEPAETAEPGRQIEFTRPLEVLLAEDSPANQKLACGLLEKWGHRVTVANNGREAVAAAQSRRFDVVLMDVHMPEMDGLEATRMIRRREERDEDHLPIVAMTAHALKGDREQCLEAGMDDYIAKPVRAARLREKLAAVIPDAVTVADDGREPADGTDAPAGSAHSREPAGPEASTAAGELSADADPIDWSEALHTTGGNQMLLKDVAEAFLDECPRLLETLKAAVGAADGSKLRIAAHTFKGNLASLGALGAAERAYRLETMGVQGQFDGAEQALAAFCEALEPAVSRLRTFIEEPPASGID